MKRIKFISAHGQSHVETPDVNTGKGPCGHEGCAEKGGWHDGDVKSVTDGDAAILLSNPQFSQVDAAPASQPSGGYTRPVAPSPSASSASEEE